jgi:hypothetical protein
MLTQRGSSSGHCHPTRTEAQLSRRPTVDGDVRERGASGNAPRLCDCQAYREVATKVRRALRISRADVYRTAGELLVHVDRPTIDRVRMRLGRGSTGSVAEGGACRTRTSLFKGIIRRRDSRRPQYCRQGTCKHSRSSAICCLTTPLTGHKTRLRID